MKPKSAPLKPSRKAQPQPKKRSTKAGGRSKRPQQAPREDPESIDLTVDPPLPPPEVVFQDSQSSERTTPKLRSQPCTLPPPPSVQFKLFWTSEFDGEEFYKSRMSLQKVDTCWIHCSTTFTTAETMAKQHALDHSFECHLIRRSVKVSASNGRSSRPFTEEVEVSVLTD